MFGLEEQKNKKKPESFIFELEKELKTLTKHKELKQKVEERIQRIKDALRTGENQDDFDQYGILLHGYTSLLKVMSRFSPR